MIPTLDVTVTPETRYCIPLWLRDLQIAQAIKRVPGRIEGALATRPDPVAVVCFGPSLAETWEALRSYQFVISCSGAHKFLVARGIIPTWHVEVDPRPHKADLIGPPDPNVEYLIASTCHAAVFDLLEGHQVKLWHVFDSTEEATRVLPAGEWAITGGSSVGLRAMTIARFLGFTNLHIFGMDGCEGQTGSHADAHPNAPPAFATTEIHGRTFRTTPSLLACARQTFHELNMMPDVRATFHGDGLVQELAKDYVPAPVDITKAMIGFQKPELISAEYRRLNAQLHASNLAYGVGGGKHAAVVRKLAENLKTTSILDYGCGKGMLAKELPWPIWEFDPAVPGKDEPPRAADIVVCTDVLEHIEPDRLLFVLDDLRRCVKQVGYFVIHTGPASKVLADGRNAHLIQQGEAWWRHQLSQFFEVGKILIHGPQLTCVVAPRKKAKSA
jgi:hypothetical protein